MPFGYFFSIMIVIFVLMFVIYLLKSAPKAIFTILGNIVLGILCLWLINKFSLFGLYIPINWATILLVGIFGLGGVVLLVILKLLGIM